MNSPNSIELRQIVGEIRAKYVIFYEIMWK